MKFSKKLVALSLCVMLGVSGTCSAGFMGRGDEGQEALQFYLSVGLTEGDLCTSYNLCSLLRFAKAFSRDVSSSTDVNDIAVPQIGPMTAIGAATIDECQNKLIDFYKTANQHDLSRFSEYVRINLDKIQEYAGGLQRNVTKGKPSLPPKT